MPSRFAVFTRSERNTIRNALGDQPPHHPTIDSLLSELGSADNADDRIAEGLDTPDTVGILPPHIRERQVGETEIEFSERMAAVQAQRLASRHNITAEAESPHAKATRVWAADAP